MGHREGGILRESRGASSPLGTLRRGMTLVEAALVLGLSALVVGAVLTTYSYATEAQKLSRSVQVIERTRQAVQNAMAASPNYLSVSTAYLIGGMPTSMLDTAGKAIVDPFGGTVSVKSDDATPGNSDPGSGYRIDLGSVPPEPCAKIATHLFEREAVKVYVNGTTAPQPVTVAAAQALCGATAANSVSFVFE